MGQYGEAGKAIRLDTSPKLASFPNYPTINDIQVGNNNSLVYARESATPLANTAINLACSLSARGRSDFREDKTAYNKEMVKLVDHDSALLLLLNSHISAASKQTLMAHPDYEAYTKSTDGHWSYKIYKLIVLLNSV